MRTFEVARLEIGKCVEAKFGLRIRDSKPGDTGSRGHSDGMDVVAVICLSLLATEKGHRVRVMGVKRTKENPKESSKEPKVPKAHARVKHRKLVYHALKTRNRDKLRNSGICTDVSH